MLLTYLLVSTILVSSDLNKPQLLVYKEDKDMAVQQKVVAAPQVRRQYVVQRGDNLWRISEQPAREHKQNIFQVMLVTKSLNTHAFIKDNINLLLSGATLDLPTLHDIEHGSVSETVLVSEIKKQNAAWAMHKDKSSQVALEISE